MEALLEILSSLHPEVDFEHREGLIKNRVLDSYDIVAILADVEAKFDVLIPAQEIRPENFDSAAALYALIRRLEDGD